MKSIAGTFTLLVFLVSIQQATAQVCDSLVPVFNVDLSSDADSLWISEDTTRNGYCCSATGADKCIEFRTQIHPGAIGVVINVYAGSVFGVLYAFDDCSGPYLFGMDTIPLSSGSGHSITFCKPGNSLLIYSIQSVKGPTTVSENKQNKIHLFPNPAESFIQVSGRIEESFEFSIIDVLGNVVLEGTNHGRNISVKDLAAGSYYLVINNDQRKSARFLKVH